MVIGVVTSPPPADGALGDRRCLLSWLLTVITAFVLLGVKAAFLQIVVWKLRCHDYTNRRVMTQKRSALVTGSGLNQWELPKEGTCRDSELDQWSPAPGAQTGSGPWVNRYQASPKEIWFWLTPDQDASLGHMIYLHPLRMLVSQGLLWAIIHNTLPLSWHPQASKTSESFSQGRGANEETEEERTSAKKKKTEFNSQHGFITTGCSTTWRPRVLH